MLQLQCDTDKKHKKLKPDNIARKPESCLRKIKLDAHYLISLVNFIRFNVIPHFKNQKTILIKANIS